MATDRKSTQASASQRHLDSVEAQADWVDGTPLRRFQGEGFSFNYPAGARIDTIASHLAGLKAARIRGPFYSMFGRWSGSREDVGRSGPAYDMRVTTVANPASEPLKRLTDSVVESYNRGCAPDCPIGEATSYKITIAGQPAIVVRPPCGDCWPYEVYFAKGTTIVAFSYTTDDDDMLDALTAPMYWLMLESFAWTS